MAYENFGNRLQMTPGLTEAEWAERMAPAPEMEEEPEMSPYDADVLRQRAAGGREMVGRAFGGQAGYAGPMLAYLGGRQERSAMADMLSHNQMMRTYKKGLYAKATKIFNDLYDSDPTNDEEAIKKLQKMAGDAKAQFGDDFGWGAKIDAFVGRRYDKEKMEQEYRLRKELAREKPLSGKEQYIKELGTDIEAGTATQKMIDEYRRMVGTMEKEGEAEISDIDKMDLNFLNDRLMQLERIKLTPDKGNLSRLLNWAGISSVKELDDQIDALKKEKDDIKKKYAKTPTGVKSDIVPGKKTIYVSWADVRARGLTDPEIKKRINYLKEQGHEVIEKP